MMRARQLIRNQDFADGLRDWHGSGEGVALVSSAGERVLRLRAEPGEPASAACAPVAVVPRGAYTAGADVRLEGAAQADVELLWLSESGAEIDRLRVKSADEALAPEGAAFASLRVTCHAGDVYLRESWLNAVGTRMEVTVLETDRPVVLAGYAAELVCEIRNTGSSAIPNPEIELGTGRQLIVPPAEPAHALPALAPGEGHTVGWPLFAPVPGVYPVQVRVRGAGRVIRQGAAVVVGEEPIRLADDGSGLAARRSHLSLSTRTFRIVLPRLEHGFGTGQFDFGDPLRFGGWIPSLGAAYGEPGEPARLLYGRRSRVAGTTIVLYNADSLAEWELTLRPSAERHSIALATQYVSRKPHVLTRLDGAPLHFANGFVTSDSVATETSCTTVAERGDRRFAARVSWRDPKSAEVAIHARPPGILRPACATLTLRQQHMPPGRRVFWQQELWVGPVTPEEA